MNGLHFSENEKVLPLLAPQDIAASATASSYIRTRDMNWITFLVSFGNLTSDSTDSVTVTVEASTAGSSNATEAAIAFDYRLSSAVNTDSMGAKTAATSAGVAVLASTGDNKVLEIDIDPAALAAASGLTDPQYLRLVLTPNAEMGACLVGVLAICESRYPGNAIPSST